MLGAPALASKGALQRCRANTSDNAKQRGPDHSAWMQDFRRLHVWAKAHALAINTLRVAKKMRASETVSLRAQIVRAAMSVPTNIVEGRAQRSDPQFARFLKIALGSATELEYHLVLASDINAVNRSDFDRIIGEVVDVKKMLVGLIKSLETTRAK